MTYYTIFPTEARFLGECTGEYLAAWAERNSQYRDQLADDFSQRGVLNDLPTSVRIANWAYQQTYNAGGLTWARKEDMVPLPKDWQRPLMETVDTPG